MNELDESLSPEVVKDDMFILIGLLVDHQGPC